MKKLILFLAIAATTISCTAPESDTKQENLITEQTVTGIWLLQSRTLNEVPQKITFTETFILTEDNRVRYFTDNGYNSNEGTWTLTNNQLEMKMDHTYPKRTIITNVLSTTNHVMKWERPYTGGTVIETYTK